MPEAPACPASITDAPLHHLDKACSNRKAEGNWLSRLLYQPPLLLLSHTHGVLQGWPWSLLTLQLPNTAAAALGR